MPNKPKATDEFGNFHCPSCNTFLPKEKFSKCQPSHASFYGIQSYCKECESYKRKIKNSKITLQEKLQDAVHRSKLRANKKGWENTLDNDWVHNQWEKQQGKCFYTGITMTYIRGEGRVWTNVSIDRIDSSQGYVAENSVLCCIGFNLMKTDLSLDDMIQMCEMFLSKFKDKETSNGK